MVGQGPSCPILLLGEAPPLMTIELLERIANLFEDYFHALNEDVIKDNFVICYQVRSGI